MVGLMVGAVDRGAAAALLHPRQPGPQGRRQPLARTSSPRCRRPAGETGGGVAHAIVGTLLIVGMASLIGLPIGIAAGIYCAEYPAQPAHLGHPFRGRRAERHAVDRGRRLRVGLDRGDAETLLGPGRERGARDADDPDGAAHDRGDDQAGAQFAARGGAGARVPALAHQPRASSCAPRCPASSPGACSRSPASPARRRRSSSPRSAASI